MKVTKVSLVVGAAMTAAVTPVAASQSGMSNVTYVFTMPNGAMLFSQAGGDRSALPSCAAGNATRWAVDATTPAGKISSI